MVLKRGMINICPGWDRVQEQGREKESMWLGSHHQTSNPALPRIPTITNNRREWKSTKDEEIFCEQGAAGDLRHY